MREFRDYEKVIKQEDTPSNSPYGDQQEQTSSFPRFENISTPACLGALVLAGPIYAGIELHKVVDTINNVLRSAGL